MSRKNIGVFISGDDEQHHCTFLQGIKERAFFYDYNVISFHSLLNKGIYGTKHEISKTVVDGEYSTFWGQDISVLDGIIMSGETYISPEIKDKLFARAREHNIPVVNMDDYDERCCSILFDDSNSMELVISHVVKEHGCKKIYFVSGYKGNLQSEERIKAYYKILKENNIPINEDYICYGEFRTDIASEVIEKLIKAYGVPDAVVCANDSMALSCISKLSALGYSVPEDCIVTGFDGIKEGESFIPSLTTVKRATKQVGITAVDALHKIFNNENLPSEIKVPAELVIKQSCGCKKKDYSSINLFFEILNGQINNLRMFENNLINMTRSYTKSNTIEEIISIALEHASYFNLPKLCVYLNENIIQDCEEINIMPASDRNNIYSDMLTRYAINFKTSETVVDHIPSSSVLTDIINASTEHIYVGLTSLYYKDKIIGFISMEHLYCTSYLPMFYTWLINTCSAIGNYCLKTEMEILIDKLGNMYIIDSLTELNNRFGLHKYADKMISRAKSNNKLIFGIEIDLDKLKLINDTYGHNDGDNAIIQIANAMRFAADEDFILSRVGGDEYFVLGLCNDEATTQKFISKINAYLEDYNQSNSLPYSIECSCGYYISDPYTHNLEEIMKYADIEMYKVKNEKKKRNYK